MNPTLLTITILLTLPLTTLTTYLTLAHLSPNTRAHRHLKHTLRT